MRIVIDLQAAQTEASGRRGIGRYSIALAKQMAQRSGDAEIWLALSGRYPQAAAHIRKEFKSLIPQDRIRLFDVPAQTSYLPVENAWRRQTAELLREAFLADLKPDFVLLGSLFEGLSEDAVTSINRLSSPFATGSVLYDLIPLLNHDVYLDNEVVKDWYFEKIGLLHRADLLFAISQSSLGEAINHLGLPTDRIVNISCGVDDVFKKQYVLPSNKALLKNTYGIKNSIIMYTGGIDHRKNVEGLIQAWALIAHEFRSRYQLAIVCSIQPQDRRRLESLSSSLGLASNDVIFTGFVPEADLVTLYNFCDLFVFPSLHEGFGLPALEAMACGAPTIGSDNSSIVEVIGMRDAMFNARSPNSIAAKIKEALENPEFRQALIENADRQVRLFSWERSADRALSAIQRNVTERSSQSKVKTMPIPRRPRLAFVSPMPPLKTGIADYSADLLRELGRYYDIEIVTDQVTVSDDFVKANYRQLSVRDFKEKAKNFDRIVYQFGNSDFHTHMFALLRQHPGVVVLHDLYLSGVQAWREHHHKEYRHFSRSLVRSHGYRALIDHLEGEADAAIWKYPVNNEIIENAIGLIVHSSFNDQSLRKAGVAAETIACVPMLRAAAHHDRETARQKIGLTEDDFLLCTFGSVGRNKRSIELVEALAECSASLDIKIKMVFVGQDDQGVYGDEFRRSLKRTALNEKVIVTGYVDKTVYETYLSAADMAIQLRALTRGETSKAVLDCMAYGIPTIVNAHGPMAELDEYAVVKLSEDPSVSEIAAAARAVITDKAKRDALSSNAVSRIRAYHSPSHIGTLYHENVESFYGTGHVSRRDTVISMAARDSNFATASEFDVAQIGRCIDLNSRLSETPRVFIDISELVVRDWKSGIQRVVKSVLTELLRNPPEGRRVEPVYACVDEHGGAYRSARKFTSRFLRQADERWEDEVVEPANGDIFIGLDLAPLLVPRMFDQGVYDNWRARGVRIHFVVYDLLPILSPEFFGPGASEDFARWVRVVAQVADSVACISRSVAIEFEKYVNEISLPNRDDLKINWFHLGSEILSPAAAIGASAAGTAPQTVLALKPYVLMVGTIEPRKGHAQILEAFETLWGRGVETRLVIVGRRGWLADDLIEKIEKHQFLGTRLSWFSDIDDVALESFYTSASGLIAASFAEGYGLPLIEAAKRGIPIFARGIPVFREVAGANAAYFDPSGQSLVPQLEEWLKKLRANAAPSSAGIQVLSWAQCTARLLETVL